MTNQPAPVSQPRPKKARSIPLATVASALFVDGALKDGPSFIAGLGTLLAGHNKNDVPFSIDEIKLQPALDKFSFPGLKDFTLIGTIQPSPLVLGLNDWTNESLRISFAPSASASTRDQYARELGCVYMITAIPHADGVERLIKFGSSRTPMKARLCSYNCGTINNLRTASTTNIKMMQSIMACRSAAKFLLYCYFCETTRCYNWAGVDSNPVATGAAVAYEDIIIKQWKSQFGSLPLANVQANMTTVK